MNAIVRDIPARACLIEQIGRELGRIRSAIEKADVRKRALIGDETKTMDRLGLERLQERLRAREWQLEEAIPAFRPETAGGALVALALANSIFDQLNSTSLDEIDKSHRFHQAQALLHSVASFLKSIAPGAFEATDSGYYMSEYLDLWPVADDADRELADQNTHQKASA